MIRGGDDLREDFAGTSLDARLGWFNEPRNWKAGAGWLELETDGGTDFWQRTSYGFRADNGHLLYAMVEGDFVLSTSLRFCPVHQYDQAGLMVRISPECWLKTSVEFEAEGPSRLGAVVTHAGYSDWSTQDFPREILEIQFRLARRAGDYRVDYALPASSRSGSPGWIQIRMAHLLEDPGEKPVQAGIYACSPKAAGYSVRFHSLTIEREMPAV